MTEEEKKLFDQLEKSNRDLAARLAAKIMENEGLIIQNREIKNKISNSK
jgi:hypothetical protein